MLLCVENPLSIITIDDSAIFRSDVNLISLLTIVMLLLGNKDYYTISLY